MKLLVYGVSQGGWWQRIAAKEVPVTIILNSQLDATTTNFIDNYNQFNMFRAIISPVLRSTRLCLQLVV
jgi:hypothetical protein